MKNETITCPLIKVSVERGRDVLTTDVPAHEVDVLRAVHGPSNVHEGEETGEEIELPIGADAEFARLQGKYRRVNAPDPVAMAHRTGPRSLEAHGFKLGRGDREPAPQAGVRNHRAKAPSADKKAGKDPAK